MKKSLFVICLFIFSIFSVVATAQEKQKITSDDYVNSNVDMADGFRQEGKIYVLTGIILVILAGMLVYVGVIDKKVSRLEKEMEK